MILMTRAWGDYGREHIATTSELNFGGTQMTQTPQEYSKSAENLARTFQTFEVKLLILHNTLITLSTRQPSFTCMHNKHHFAEETAKGSKRQINDAGTLY
jgi:hypothetical protein